MANNYQLIAALALSGLIGIAHADEKEELLKLRNTTINLIKQLVKQGVLTEKIAEGMIKQAEQDAEKQAVAAKSAKPAANQATAANTSAETAAKSEKQAVVAEPVPADEIRVAYVPDFVKEEIRQQVRNDLKQEVVSDVMQKAKDEQWGIPDALPEWTRRFTLSGDLRLREQSSLMANGNSTLQQNIASSSYLNYNAINGVAGFQQADPSNANSNAWLDTTENQHLARERFRLGIDVDVAKNVDAGIRLATGNTQNPVSTNQTLGNTGYGYQFAVDRAFLRYNAYDSKKVNWLTAMAGRTPNPFFTGGSEMVWDEDLSFEGLATTFRQNFGNTDLTEGAIPSGPTIYATTGVFPIQAQNPLTGLTSLQKWLFGAQTGFDWDFSNQDNFKFGAAYYDYQGIKGVKNNDPVNNSCLNSPASVTQSIPQFIQGGNSMIGLCNTANNSGYAQLYGLASDYKTLNFNAAYDFSFFSPIHLKLSGDYARNIGYTLNQNWINSVTKNGVQTIPGNQVTGWQVKLDLGWPSHTVAGNWDAYVAYRYLEADAVLSSYTDSDFHLGSTNVKGWMLAGNYGLMKNIWLSGRWMSADVIVGPKYSMDILQLDLNTRF